MWTLFKNWIYDLVVQSGIVFKLLWVFGPLHMLSLVKFHNGDCVRDEAGRKLKVTKWNGRPMGAFGPKMYAKIENLKIRKDDVFLCGYPKTGCHWTFEILHMLVNKKAEVTKYGKIIQGMVEAMPEIIFDSVPSPRVLNTHVFYHELPKGVRENKNKIVLTIRCPKDTAVSFYNHTRALQHYYCYDGTFENYFKMFIKGGTDYGEYFDHYLSWNEAMKSQTDNEIYLMSFEELKENPVAKIMELAEFLGSPITREFAEEVANVSSFSKLKEKRTGNPLFRKGVVGDWQNWLTEEQAAEVDNAWRKKMAGFKLPPTTKEYCRP